MITSLNDWKKQKDSLKLNESADFKFKSHNTPDLSSIKSYLDEKGFKYFTPESVNGIFELEFAVVLQVNPAMEVYAKSINKVKSTGTNEYSYDNGYGTEYEFLQNALLIIEGKNAFSSINISNALDKNPIKINEASSQQDIQERADAINQFGKLIKADNDSSLELAAQDYNYDLEYQGGTLNTSYKTILNKYNMYDKFMQKYQELYGEEASIDPAGGHGLRSHESKVNESSSDLGLSANDILKELIASGNEELEIVTLGLSNYFKESAEELTNMDANKIAEHFKAIYDLIRRRTGN